MKPERIAQLRAYVALAERMSAERLTFLHGARFGFRAGAYEMRLAGLSGTSTMSKDAAKESWIRAARKRIAQAEDDCHEDPINLAGSGPVPISAREG